MIILGYFSYFSILFFHKNMLQAHVFMENKENYPKIIIKYSSLVGPPLLQGL